MSAQWNSNQPNRLLGNEHNSRAYVVGPMVLSCRICGKVFLSSGSLIEHYESHQNEYTLINRLRERRDRNLSNNPLQPRRLFPQSTFQSPRYHPYLPNAFPTSISQSRPFLASTQTQNLLQPTQNLLQQRHPIANNCNNLGVSFPFPNSSSSAGFGARYNQFFHHQQPSSTHKVSTQQQMPLPGLQSHNPDADNRSVWYLSQLEKPIPKLIDLDAEDETCDHLKLDLTLKL